MDFNLLVCLNLLVHPKPAIYVCDLQGEHTVITASRYSVLLARSPGGNRGEKKKTKQMHSPHLVIGKLQCMTFLVLGLGSIHTCATCHVTLDPKVAPRVFQFRSLFTSFSLSCFLIFLHFSYLSILSICNIPR